MLRTTETFVRAGKPLPKVTCDRVAPANTLVPSKKEAQLALDTLEDNDKLRDGRCSDALDVLQRFLDTR